jgi:hypothetical protein
MDSASLQVVRKLWNAELGIIFLMTITTKLQTGIQSISSVSHDFDSTGGSNITASFLSFFSEPNSGIVFSLHSIVLLNSDANDFGTADTTQTSADLCSRLHVLELKNISQEATFALVRTTLDSFDMQDDLTFMMEKIFAISGGNPLYATELSKALGQTYQQIITHQRDIEKEIEYEQSGNDSSKDESLAKLTEALSLCKSSRADVDTLIQNLHISRIEEVIQYRFDQLSSTTQILLKMISVASANGSRVSLPLLASMIVTSQLGGLSDLFEVCFDNDDDEDVISLTVLRSIMLRVVELLDEEIFSRQAFLVLSPIKSELSEKENIIIDELSFLSSVSSQEDGFHGADLLSIQRHQLGLGNIHLFCVYFDIELERKSIYGIMLDNQKAALHDCVAAFLQEHLPINTDSKSTYCRIL